MDYKKTNAARTTITRNTSEMIDKVDNNMYEMVVTLARRSNQIGKEIKEELHAKLEEFATHQDNLEEVFENREQIEISKFYERLPKPPAIAIDELMNDGIYRRTPDVIEETLLKKDEE